MSKGLDKRSILACADRKVLPVEVPEWGGTVHLRTLSLGEGLRFQAERKALGDDAGDQVVPLLLGYSLCDEDGSPLFRGDDAKQLEDKNPAVLGRLFALALELVRGGKEPETEEERGNG